MTNCVSGSHSHLAELHPHIGGEYQSRTGIFGLQDRNFPIKLIPQGRVDSPHFVADSPPTTYFIHSGAVSTLLGVEGAHETILFPFSYNIIISQF